MSEVSQQNITFGDITTTILDTTDLSGLVDTKNNVITSIITPPNFDGATLSLEVSSDKATFVPLVNSDGTPYTLTVSASQAVIVIPQFVAGWRWMKLKSNVAQSAGDADLIIIARPV